MSNLGGTQKRRGTNSKTGGVKWDEANLQDNEVIKAALQPFTKIREPKTPYHGPASMDSDSDSGMQMDFLALDRESSVEAASSGRSADDGEAHANGVHGSSAASEEAGSREADQQQAERQPSVAWGEVEVQGAAHPARERADGLNEAAAHARFEEMRRAHYRLPRHTPASTQNSIDYDVEQDNSAAAQQQAVEAAQQQAREAAEQEGKDADQQEK